jgi:rhodanese-related sulfurtransferase
MIVRRQTLIVILVLLALLVVLGSCAEKAPTTTSQTTTTIITSVSIKDITTKEAFDLIHNNQENQNFVIIDVRTPDEYNSGHLQKALNLDVNSGTFEQEINKLDRNKIYLVYCKGGTRSRSASEIMLGQNFKNINNMLGGITQWQSDGYPIVE